MTSRLRLVAGLAFVFATSVGSAAVAESDPLRIGVTDFPPWFVVEDEEVAGIVPRGLAPVFEKLGIPVAFELRPIARLKSEVTSGRLDCRAASWSEEDEASTYHFTHEPLYRLAYSVFGRSGDTARPRSFDGLRALPPGLRWGLVHGLTYTDEMLAELEAAGTILRSWENRDNLLLLLQERLDLVVAEPLTFLHLAEQEDVLDDIELVTPALIHKDYYLACLHDSETEENLHRFDDRFREFRDGEEWNGILAEYLNDSQRDIYRQIAGDLQRRE